MPKGVRSQLSSGAGIGSRCWVDTKQPHSSSPTISQATPALLGEGQLSLPTASRAAAPASLPSVKNQRFLPTPMLTEGHVASSSEAKRPTVGEDLSLIYIALNLGLVLKTALHSW